MSLFSIQTVLPLVIELVVSNGRALLKKRMFGLPETAYLKKCGGRNERYVRRARPRQKTLNGNVRQWRFRQNSKHF